ncbi:MAG: phosphatase PAP2 family protein [Vicinamibacteria bacterium]|nr:phosphatase PAP2 family protein [Vicinamibacteria bacterium]
MNAVLTYLGNSDRRLSDRFADWSPPRWLRLWMLSATRLGDGWLWAFIALGLLAAGDYGVLAAASAACGLANGIMIALKRKFRRSRPCGQGINQFFQLVKADLSAFDGFSFPSGHTMNAFAIGTVLSRMHPSLLPVMAFMATSIAASRLVLRMHFLTDILAGAFLGVAIGGFVCRAFS